MADAIQPFPPGTWSTTYAPKSIMTELAVHEGKRVLLILNTSGASRQVGRLKAVLPDGVIIEVEDSTAPKARRVFVMAPSIATVEIKE